MAWQLIGTATAVPGEPIQEVGPITVPTAGGVEIAVRSVVPVPFRWGNGYIRFKSSNGYELGSVKVWPKPIRESYLLGQELTASINTGVLEFEARGHSIRWVMAGFPLVVEVLADLPSDLPSDRTFVQGFLDSVGNVLDLVGAGTLGRLRF